MSAHVPVRDRINRKLKRTWKFAARYVTTLSAGTRQAPNALFVLGSGRSGTRVPLVALERSPETITYCVTPGGSAQRCSGTMG